MSTDTTVTMLAELYTGLFTQYFKLHNLVLTYYHYNYILMKTGSPGEKRAVDFTMMRG